MIQRERWQRQASVGWHGHHRGSRRLLLAFLAGALAMAMAACGPPPMQRPAPPDPKILVDVGEMPFDFLVHQEVRATFGDDKLVFQAVIQKQGRTLTIVTLAPDGSRAYLIEQTGMAVRSEKYVSRELPFSPMHILQDVHRCYFMKGEAGDANAIGAQTTRTRRMEEFIDEHYEGPRLVKRIFRDATPAASDGEVIASVEYKGGAETLLEQHVLYRNAKLNYLLDIRPLAYNRLEPPATDSAAGATEELPSDSSADDAGDSPEGAATDASAEDPSGSSTESSADGSSQNL